MIVVNSPLWSEEVNGFREEVIVYKPGVDGEQTHQQNDVTTSKYYIPYLVAAINTT